MSQFILKFSLLVVLGINIQSCTNKNYDEDLSLEATKQFYEKSPVKLLPVLEPKVGLAYYKLNGKFQSVEWSKCQLKKSEKFVVVFNSKEERFSGKDFCGRWLAQSFLKKGYSILGINLPGFGRSVGKKSFDGEVAVLAARAAMAKSKLTDDGRLTGVWGYGESTVPAAYLARSEKNVSWAIFGGGLFDAEITMNDSKDEVVKSWLTETVKSHGEDALETHSIAWDIDGLPSKVLIYHGQNDTSFPMTQVQSFKDSLASEGVDVSLDVLPGVAHKLNTRHHQRILMILLGRI